MRTDSHTNRAMSTFLSEEHYLRWNEEHTAYLCADMVEVAVRRRTPQPSGRHAAKKAVLRNRPLVEEAPRNVLLYPSGRGVSAAVSDALLSRDAVRLVRAGGDARTYSLPGTVRDVGAASFRNSRVEAVRLNHGLESVDAGLFDGSAVRLVWLPATLRNAGALIRSGRGSRTFVLPNGLWIAISFSGNRQTATLVVPQDVREIVYNPIYKGLGVSGVRVLPGSRLERIGDGAFAETDLREFVAPPSLREIGHVAFANCRRLARVELHPGTRVDDLCFWRTGFLQEFC